MFNAHVVLRHLKGDFGAGTKSGVTFTFWYTHTLNMDPRFEIPEIEIPGLAMPDVDFDLGSLDPGKFDEPNVKQQ